VVARLLAAWLPLATVAGCIHEVLPPPVPGPVQLSWVGTPAPAEHGRVYVDVVDGPTIVRAVRSVSITATVNDQVFDWDVLETEQQCRTPCYLDMPLGQQALAFPLRGSRQEEVVDVPVSTTPSLYRRALGSRRPGGAGFVLGVLGTTFGGISFTTGAALLPVGLATGTSGLTTSGAITLGVGAALVALGIWAIADHPILEQSGAGARYDLTP
jgi:hypothetical protein